MHRFSSTEVNAVWARSVLGWGTTREQCGVESIFWDFAKKKNSAALLFQRIDRFDTQMHQNSSILPPNFATRNLWLFMVFHCQKFEIKTNSKNLLKYSCPKVTFAWCTCHQPNYTRLWYIMFWGLKLGCTVGNSWRTRFDTYSQKLWSMRAINPDFGALRAAVRMSPKLNIMSLSSWRAIALSVVISKCLEPKLQKTRSCFRDIIVLCNVKIELSRLWSKMLTNVNIRL